MKKPNNKPLPEGVIISDSFKRKPRIKKFLKKKYVLIAVAAVLVVSGLLVLFLKNQKEPEAVALQVGKYSYTQTEYNKLIAQAKDMQVSEVDARKSLREALAARQAADDLNVSYPTDQTTLNLEATRKYQLDRIDTQVSDYQRNTSYTPLINSLVALGVYGGYKVGYVEFQFARYIVGGDNSQWHNINLINEDIAYAKTQAEQSRQAILDKKQSVEALADKVRADKRLTNEQTGNASEVFFVADNGSMYSSRYTGNTVEPTLLQAIKQAPVGKATDIMMRSWSNSTGLKLPSIQHGTSVDYAYYFIIVQSKSPARPTLQTDFNSHKQGYL
jgi:hypothetical protein